MGMDNKSLYGQTTINTFPRKITYKQYVFHCARGKYWHNGLSSESITKWNQPGNWTCYLWGFYIVGFIILITMYTNMWYHLLEWRDFDLRLNKMHFPRHPPLRGPLSSYIRRRRWHHMVSVQSCHLPTTRPMCWGTTGCPSVNPPGFNSHQDQGP